MSKPLARPRIFNPPDPAPPCCTQRTITIARAVTEKLRQKHPYWSREWHASYERRSAVERSFSWVKDKARLDVTRGAIRVMGTAKQRLISADSHTPGHDHRGAGELSSRRLTHLALHRLRHEGAFGAPETGPGTCGDRRGTTRAWSHRPIDAASGREGVASRLNTVVRGLTVNEIAIQR